MRTTFQLIFFIGAMCATLSCERTQKGPSLSYAEVLKEAESKKGEIVDVKGQRNVSYIWSGSVTIPVAIDNKGRSGTSHRGLTMNFQDSPGYYHEIDLYDGSDGGGLLIGRKIAAEPKAQE